MKKQQWFIVLLGALVVAYFLGPEPEPFDPYPRLPEISVGLGNLSAYVDSIDQSAPYPVKKENEAEIVWFDSVSGRTEYALLYLHGFAASKQEGYPVHIDFAKRYGMNLYLPRLERHGLETEAPLSELEADKYFRSALQALAVASKLGEKVIIMSTSTGGTFSLYLSANFPDLIAGQILYSPNIDFQGGPTWLLTKPWGLQIGRVFLGSKNVEAKIDAHEDPEKIQKYWYTRYRLEGVVALRQVVDQLLGPEVYAEIENPVFIGMYYKSPAHQDEVIKIDAIEEMIPMLKTPSHLLTVVRFKNVGDHVVASEYKSEDVDFVKVRTYQFAEEKLELEPVDPSVF